MKIKNITKLLMSSCKTKIEKDLWDLWKTLYPLMIKKELKFMSFDEYKNECKGKTYSKKSYKDIQSEMLSVVKNHERGGGK
jgi:hypothetical protein